MTGAVSGLKPCWRGIVTPARRSAEKPDYHRAGTSHDRAGAAASAGQPAGTTGTVSELQVLVRQMARRTGGAGISEAGERKKRLLPHHITRIGNSRNKEEYAPGIWRLKHVSD
jgi:hypothetical protein